MRFVYVMRKEDSDAMLAMGYTLVKEDKYNHVWVFENRDVTSFASADELTTAGIPHVLSDILTF